MPIGEGGVTVLIDARIPARARAIEVSSSPNDTARAVARRVEEGALVLDHAETCGAAEVRVPCVSRKLAEERAKRRCLAAAVRSDDRTPIPAEALGPSGD
jgi:hypothetical protein